MVTLPSEVDQPVAVRAHAKGADDVSGLGVWLGVAQGGLVFDFASQGGDAVLLMKAGALPTLTQADYNFRPSQPAQAEQVGRVISGFWYRVFEWVRSS